MKVYGLPNGQDQDGRNDMIRAADSGQIICIHQENFTNNDKQEKVFKLMTTTGSWFVTF